MVIGGLVTLYFTVIMEEEKVRDRNQQDQTRLIVNSGLGDGHYI